MRRESDENDVAMRTSLPFERNKRASNTSTDGPLPDDSRTPCNLCKRRGTTKWEYNARQHRRRCRWRRLRRLMSEKNGDIKFAFKCTERKKNKRNEPNENIYSKAKNARAKWWAAEKKNEIQRRRCCDATQSDRPHLHFPLIFFGFNLLLFECGTPNGWRYANMCSKCAFDYSLLPIFKWARLPCRIQPRDRTASGCLLQRLIRSLSHQSLASASFSCGAGALIYGESLTELQVSSAAAARPVNRVCNLCKNSFYTDIGLETGGEFISSPSCSTILRATIISIIILMGIDFDSKNTDFMCNLRFDFFLLCHREMNETCYIIHTTAIERTRTYYRTDRIYTVALTQFLMAQAKWRPKKYLCCGWSLQ